LKKPSKNKAMKKFLTLYFLLAGSLLFASEQQQLLEDANKAYNQAKYDSALLLYHQIEEAGYHSAALYYNMGNAYYRSEDLASAILQYEKAIRLAPDNEDIQYNLQHCNQLIKDKIEATPPIFYIRWWNGFSMLLTPSQWAISILVLICFVCTSIGFYLFLHSYTARKTSFLSALLLIVFTITAFGAAIYRNKQIHQNNQAIIFTYTLNVKASPDDNSSTLFVIHEGLKVKLTDKIGEWHEIKIPNGDKGWVKKSDLKDSRFIYIEIMAEYGPYLFGPMN